MLNKNFSNIQSFQGYGLLVILINAKLINNGRIDKAGYGLLVILINAKLGAFNSVCTLRYGLLVILINAKHILITEESTT